MSVLPRRGRPRRERVRSRPRGRRSLPQAGVGAKTRAAGPEPLPRSPNRNEGDRMDLHLNGRGMRITEHIREVADHKLSRLGRMEPKLVRVEGEVIAEPNPRPGG